MHEEYGPEVWVPLQYEGCEEKYMVSSYGRVWNNYTEVLVSPQTSGSTGHCYVNLTLDNKTKKRLSCRVNDIVLRSFSKQPNTRSVAWYKDRNIQNNNINNLYWEDKSVVRGLQSNDKLITIRGTMLPLKGYLRSLGFEEKIIQVIDNAVTSGLTFSDALLTIINNSRVGKLNSKMSYRGRTVYIKDFCDLYGMDYNTIKERNSLGWVGDDLLRGFQFKPLSEIIQTDKHYFPDNTLFEAYHSITSYTRAKKIKEGMSYQEIVDFSKGREDRKKAKLIRKKRITTTKPREVKDRWKPSVCGVGFLGVGEYNTSTSKCYKVWLSMLSRCYNPRVQERLPSYKGCSVCVEWHNFQTFSSWFYTESNYEEGFHLDKDIKVQGNKVYSPTTCIFVSQTENTIAARAKVWHFLDKEGEPLTVYNLARFCREQSLCVTGMRNLHKGVSTSYKGYTKKI